MRITISLLLTLVMSVLLTACNPLGTDNTPQPLALAPINHPATGLQRLWSQSIGSGDSGYYFRLLPAVSSGRVFAGSYNGDIGAFNANTGKSLWSRSLGVRITSGLEAANGMLFLGTENQQIYALNANTGQIIWRVTVDSEVLAAPKYARGILLVHSFDGTLVALSAKDGHTLWRYDQSTPSLILHAASQPQVAGGHVVAGFANGQLSILNLWTGASSWNQQIALAMGDNPVSQMVPVTVDPVVVDGIVYVATYQGYIAALNLDNGQMIWHHKISSYAGIAADSQQVYVSDANSNVWAFDEESGAVNWRQKQLVGRDITGPVLVGNNVIVASRLGSLQVLSKSDGHFVSRLSLGSGALAKPVVSGRTLYIYTSKGSLQAIRVH
jgi:outer membrane protein assembly factor BamB